LRQNRRIRGQQHNYSEEIVAQLKLRRDSRVTTGPSDKLLELLGSARKKKKNKGRREGKRERKGNMFPKRGSSGPLSAHRGEL